MVSEVGAVIAGDIDANSKTYIIISAKSCGSWFMWNFEACSSPCMKKGNMKSEEMLMGQ